MGGWECWRCRRANIDVKKRCTNCYAAKREAPATSVCAPGDVQPSSDQSDQAAFQCINRHGESATKGSAPPLGSFEYGPPLPDGRIAYPAESATNPPGSARKGGPEATSHVGMHKRDVSSSKWDAVVRGPQSSLASDAVTLARSVGAAPTPSAGGCAPLRIPTQAISERVPTGRQGVLLPPVEQSVRQPLTSEHATSSARAGPPPAEPRGSGLLPLAHPALSGSSPNQDQMQAATHEAHTALIIFAPAGAGKTLTLVQRAIHLVVSGLPSESVLCLTFTRKAASELSARLAAATPAPVEVRTFHAWCLRLLRMFNPGLCESGLAASSQQLAFVGEALRAWQMTHGQDKEIGGELSSERRQALCRRILRSMGHARLCGLAAAPPPLQGAFGTFVLQHYTQSLRTARLFDMGELQQLVVQLLQDEQVIWAVQRRYRHILVDEYQDTNSQQLALLRLVRHRSSETSASGLPIGITVVGDDDQSIYSFRGAEPGIFQALLRYMPDCSMVTLSQNYRSSGHILHAASALVSKNPGRISKRAWTANAEGQRVVVCECANAACEMDWIAARILELRKQNTPFSDMAILYRTHAIGRQLQSALRERRVPLRCAARDVFKRSDVAPIVSLLRLLCHPDDSATFQAVALACKAPLPAQLHAAIADDAARRSVSQLASARALHAATGPLPPSPAKLDALRPLVESAAAHMHGGGRAALHALLQGIDKLMFSARNLPPSELLNAVLESGLAGGIPAHAAPPGVRLLSDELTAAMDAFESHGLDSTVTSGGVVDRLAALRDFIEHVALCEFEDAPDDGSKPKRETNGITISTMHGAKGLEWPVVFIVRCNEDTIPLNASTGGDELSLSLIQEERRLLYVAMTRSRSNLFISYLMIGSDKQPLAVSSFLQDVPSAHRLNMQHMNVEHADLHFGVPSVKHSVPSRSQLKPISSGSQMAANVPGALGEQLRYWQQVRQEQPPQAARKRKAASQSATSGRQHSTARRPRNVSSTASNGHEHDLPHDGDRAPNDPMRAQKRSGGRQCIIVSDEDDFA